VFDDTQDYQPADHVQAKGNGNGNGANDRADDLGDDIPF